jgi:PIN domain nuclease of toxin-antitoxin system
LKLLLDTHVLVWLAEGTGELSRGTRAELERAARMDGIAVSAIAFWEVAMLARRGRISFTRPVAAWRQHVLEQPGIVEIPIDGEVAVESVELPGELHPDPADRLILATARVHGCRLATRDRRLIEYGAAGHVTVMVV